MFHWGDQYDYASPLILLTLAAMVVLKRLWDNGYLQRAAWLLAILVVSCFGQVLGKKFALDEARRTTTEIATPVVASPAASAQPKHVTEAMSVAETTRDVTGGEPDKAKLSDVPAEFHGPPIHSGLEADQRRTPGAKDQKRSHKVRPERGATNSANAKSAAAEQKIRDAAIAAEKQLRRGGADNRPETPETSAKKKLVDGQKYYWTDVIPRRRNPERYDYCASVRAMRPSGCVLVYVDDGKDDLIQSDATIR